MRRLWPAAERTTLAALAALEVAATEVTIGFHVTDHGLDGGAASELAFDRSEDAALLAGDEDAAPI